MRTPSARPSVIFFLVWVSCILLSRSNGFGQSVRELTDSIRTRLSAQESVVTGLSMAQLEVENDGDTLAPKSLTRKYALVYRLLNAGGSEEGNVSTGLKTDSALIALQRYRLAPQKEVFGWHPYWMDEAAQNYRYNLLTTLAFFSYDIDPASGRYKNEDAIKKWKESPLIDEAKKMGCKVLLSITCFGKDDTKTFLRDAFAQAVLIDSVKALLKIRQADGVDVDFEAMPPTPEVRKGFSAFIRQLAEELRTTNPSAIVNIDLHSQYDPGVYDIQELNRYADSFVLMGYDFAGAATGPNAIAPLLWSREDAPADQKRKIKSLKKSGFLDIGLAVDAYVNQAKLPAEKLILALPYYGGDWSVGASKDTLFRHLSYRQIMSLGNKDSTTFDWTTLSNRFSYLDTSGIRHVVWHDDSLSLAMKFDWAVQQKLKGVAVWALGYDDGFPEMWQTIARRFSLEVLGDTRPAVSFTSFIWQFRYPIAVNLLFLLTFMALGFILALFNWKIRERLFFSRTYRTVYIVLFFILAVAVLSILDLQWKRNAIFSAGLIVGTLIAGGIQKLSQYYRDRIPR